MIWIAFLSHFEIYSFHADHYWIMKFIFIATSSQSSFLPLLSDVAHHTIMQ